MWNGITLSPPSPPLSKDPSIAAEVHDELLTKCRAACDVLILSTLVIRNQVVVTRSYYGCQLSQKGVGAPAKDRPRGVGSIEQEVKRKHLPRTVFGGSSEASCGA